MTWQMAKYAVVLVVLAGLTGAARRGDCDTPPPEPPKIGVPVRRAMPVLVPLQASAEWSGRVSDQKLRVAAAEGHHVVQDPMVWESIWKTWNGEEKLPEIDFKADLLLVFTSSGPNQVCLKLYVSNGNVNGTVGQTLIGGPGFGYRILQVPRRDVTSFFGKPIE